MFLQNAYTNLTMSNSTQSCELLSTKANVLLIGSGGLGTMAAYNLEYGGKARVTAVLRSNYLSVKENGFTITSIDHGFIKNWCPSQCQSDFSPFTIRNVF